MANPVRPLGRSSGRDIYDEAAIQDLERQISEDELHFRMTGENRRPRRLDNPIVDNNPSPDIANDGDSYDINNFNNDLNDAIFRTEPEGYSEDNPSEFIDVPSQNSRRSELGRTDSFSRNQHQRVGEQYADIARERVMDAYNRREREKEDKEFVAIKEKRIERSKNAIMELKIDDEE